MVGQKKGQTVEYVRVSESDQDQARQVEAVAEFDRLFAEKVSDKSVDDRRQLQEMLASMSARATWSG